MTTAQTPDLLPCPFCGSAKVTAKNEHTDLSGGYYIECSACLACTGLRYACGEDPRPLLAELWNRRAELEARKPLPLSYDARLRLRSDVARAIWDVMREHEDRCDHALEDVEPKHQVWDCADAAIETALGIIPRPNPLIARREVVAGGPVRVTRLRLTEEGRAGLTSNATGPLPGITGGSS